jgi:hypothetical protein
MEVDERTGSVSVSVLDDEFDVVNKECKELLLKTTVWRACPRHQIGTNGLIAAGTSSLPIQRVHLPTSSNSSTGGL